MPQPGQQLPQTPEEAEALQKKVREAFFKTHPNFKTDEEMLKRQSEQVERSQEEIEKLMAPADGRG